MSVTMICISSDLFYRFGNDRIYEINYARYTTLKNHFLWFMLGRMTVMRISK